MASNLTAILADAAQDGIISDCQAEQLQAYIALRSPAAVFSDPSGIDASPIGDTETPRFVRGFHDVLITIGIVIVLAGIWGVGSFYAVLPAIVILAEVLVRRQRLALPAVALTIAFVQWIAVIAALMIDTEAERIGLAMSSLLYVLPFPVLLAPFYWRYRVPLSLALLFMSACALGLAAVFYVIMTVTGDADFILNHRSATSLILLFAALALFMLALGFDLKDPPRTTRNSDVAFWLHLAAAPALLYAMLSFVFVGGADGFAFFSQSTGSLEAFLVVVIVMLFMGIGLVIDRRAFVTSGLLSLGFAIYQLFQKAELALDLYVFVTLLIVGLVVLTIGIGWPRFRRMVVGRLPASLQTKLPPLG
ncbi:MULTISPECIES: hypothetical protein [Alphaproteobacteria]|uniref:DUF2157 domain-containing protein n=2 Tax=Alphaproteobacteria TaxID=28211 RepID=A0A512HEQ0_9HYPH|nr:MULTISPECIES: hypothetical protein [Alphaproteobacteria]GEO83934.1 hypothetical protein RNA01_08660 [Ciceribacter naphthalenivorans]GLR21188.1 hypothetical protein GCM10007920_09740 [Ciceribacter naphthalenivorans]GLT04044.1 hypothetical protein GCM10007926_09740 [Sphingomonas psychrolutea]